MNKLNYTINLNKIIISFLIMLLLLSPCSVRNYLETALGIETTKTLNPNKYGVPQSLNNCVVWENAIQTNKTVTGKKQIQNKQARVLNEYFALFTFDDKDKSAFLKSRSSQQIIPYYILYKRLNVYDI